MATKTAAVQKSERNARPWRMGVIVAATVLLAAAVSGGVVGKTPNAGGNPSPNGLPPGPVAQASMLNIVFEQQDGTTFPVEIKDFSFGVENPTTIGSATGGAGAGKIKFNEFTIKKTTDKASPVFFKSCATGQHFKTVTLEMRKAGGDPTAAGTSFLKFKFDTVFTTKIDWSGPGDEGPEESITFVYGKLGITYVQQDASGNETSVAFGWDQVQNQSWEQ